MQHALNGVRHIHPSKAMAMVCVAKALIVWRQLSQPVHVVFNHKPPFLMTTADPQHPLLCV